MTGATHMIVSAAIYRLGMFNKPLIPAITFGSHFLLDAIPHHGMSRTQNYILSALTGAFLSYKGWRKKDYLPLWAVFFGILPDVIDKLALSSTFSKIHGFLYYKKQAPEYFLFVELLVACFLLFYVIYPENKFREMSS